MRVAAIWVTKLPLLENEISIVIDIAHQFMTRLDHIDASPLPVVVKPQAVRDITFSNIQHLFTNVHIPQKGLSEMDSRTVQLVRK